MIRPNLRHILAAAVSMFAATSVANAQYPPQGGMPMMYQPMQSPYQPPMVNHQVTGDPDLWDGEQPIEKFLTNVAQRSWVRLEFMMWNFRRPGDGIVGAPVTGLTRYPDPTLVDGLNVPVDMNDNLNGGTAVGQTLLAQFAGLGDEDIPSLRGTLGVDLTGAEMELSFFGTQQTSDDITHNDISGNRIKLFALDNTIDPELGTAQDVVGSGFGLGHRVPVDPNYAIPLLTDGGVSDLAGMNALIFNDSLRYEMESQMWGSELAFLSEKKLPGGAGASWQWLGGVRYLSLDEGFNIFGTNGTFNGTDAITVDRITRIKSTTVNNLYGPEFGGRFALTSKYLTFSVTPRVMFGLNDHTSTVVADPVGLGAVRKTEENIDFGTVTQLNLATELHFNPNFSVFAGYDFMWLPRVTRPDENIIYNSVTPAAGGPATVSISEHLNFTDFLAQGFSVGATFRY